jgi:hypothetical protein
MGRTACTEPQCLYMDALKKISPNIASRWQMGFNAAFKALMCHHHHLQEGLGFPSCSLYPRNEISPSISTSVVLFVFVLFV